MENISIIAAVSWNNVIGIDNKLPWNLRSDLTNFKKLTSGHAVVMGRKTFESIGGKPLKNRLNVVISKSDRWYDDLNIITCSSLEEAIDVLRSDGSNNEIFIIGGQSLYLQSLSMASKIYLTCVKAIVEGDTYFPFINPKEWKEISRVAYKKGEQDQYDFDIVELKRI